MYVRRIILVMGLIEQKKKEVKVVPHVCQSLLTIYFVDMANTLLPSPLCLYDYWVALAIMATIHWLTHSTPLDFNPTWTSSLSVVRHLRASPRPTFATPRPALPFLFNPSVGMDDAALEQCCDWLALLDRTWMLDGWMLDGLVGLLMTTELSGPISGR